MYKIHAPAACHSSASSASIGPDDGVSFASMAALVPVRATFVRKSSFERHVVGYTRPSRPVHVVGYAGHAHLWRLVLLEVVADAHDDRAQTPHRECVEPEL